MKIFVVGATGYVGSHIARHLATQGHEVIGFCRNQDSATKLSQWGLDSHIGDIADLADLTATASRVDATVFAPQLMQDEEQKTVSALLATYAGTNKSFVFTSGTGVLGQRTNGDWSEESFAEDDEFVPSKFLTQRVATEQMVRAAVTRGVRGIVMRPPMIWGNGLHPMVDLLAQSVHKTGAACYIGRGLSLYSTVHVDDLVEAYRLALERGTPGALYHCVSGELNNRSIAELIGKRLAVPTRSVTMDEGIDIWGKFAVLIVMSVCSRSRSPRARAELGWRPRHFDVPGEILQGELRALA
jgi:nucleoside-diphosphate-sugar epimerase